MCSYYQHAQPLEISSQKSATSLDTATTLTNTFPTAFFLDPSLHTCKPLPPPAFSPSTQLPIPPSIQHALGDVRSRKALAQSYFTTASKWLPLISQARFYTTLFDPLRCTDPGITCILLAMKLLLSHPSSDSTVSELYFAAKSYLLRLEIAGQISIATLQANLLIGMYEIGHAIFPSAFTTVSTCARHAVVLGIEGTVPVQGKAWMEQEERNRIWWGTIILDR